MKKLTMLITAGLMFLGASAYAQNAGQVTKQQKKDHMTEKYSESGRSKAEVKQHHAASADGNDRQERKRP